MKTSNPASYEGVYTGMESFSVCVTPRVKPVYLISPQSWSIGNRSIVSRISQ